MRWQTLVLAMTLIVVCVVAARTSRAASVSPPGTALTFWVCDKGNPAFRASGDKLLIRCPSAADPNKVVFTIQGCVGPRVKKFTNPDRYTVSCDRMIQYTPGVPIDP